MGIEALADSPYRAHLFDGESPGTTLGLSDADAKKAGKPRLLGVDNVVVVPVNKNIIAKTGACFVRNRWGPCVNSVLRGLRPMWQQCADTPPRSVASCRSTVWQQCGATGSDTWRW